MLFSLNLADPLLFNFVFFITYFIFVLVYFMFRLDTCDASPWGYYNSCV